MLSGSRFPPSRVFWIASAVEIGIGFTALRDILADMRPSAIIAIFLTYNISVITVWVVFVYPYFYSPLRHLPRPKGEVPLIGQGAKPYKKPLGETYLKWMTEVPNDGLIAYRSFLNDDRLLLTSPKAIADVLVRKPYHYEKLPEERSIIGRFLGDGLTIVEGKEHQLQRKRLTPIYSLRNIQLLQAFFWSKAVKLTQCISRDMEQNKSRVDEPTEESNVYEINHWANQATIDIIGVAGLGMEFNCLNKVENELFAAYQEIFTWAPEKEIYMALNRILSPKVIEFIPWGINERIDVTTAILRRACRTLVDQKFKAHREEGNKHDILSLMISQGDWTPEQLVEQLLTFIAAGHETSASSFTWACNLLAEHPEVQVRLWDELRSTVAPLLAVDIQEGSASLSCLLDSLPYLNAVCNEVLRFYPPVPLIRRYSITPTTILGQTIPAGTRVILCPWASNRNPLHWGPDAGVFKPERWIDPVTGRCNKEGGMSSNYANLKFSHGPRSCIGQNFAKAELRTLVAVFVSKFKFQMAVPGEKIVPVGIVSVRPKDGMHLKIEMRA